MKDKPHALGMVIKDRWDLTLKTFDSLSHSQQPNSSYDLFLVDNASSPENQYNLKNYLASTNLPVKNAFFLGEEASISQAYNLFLAAAQDYKWRTKFDNDLVLKSTVSINMEEPAAAVPIVGIVERPNENSSAVIYTPGKKPKRFLGTPDGADASFGSPRSVSIVKGAQKVHRQKEAPVHTKFLDHMVECIENTGADVVSLLPCNPKVLFPMMLEQISHRQIGGRPYLIGACMMFGKNVFDNLGYFDERLPRKIDIEYSQRAIKNKMNIGYHPHYWITHMGHNSMTEVEHIIKTKEEISWKILQGEDQPELPYKSMWEKVVWKLRPALKKSIIINLK